MSLDSLVDHSLSDRVTDRLREAILSGDLKPGERLVERKLAEQLGVSHIPIREALAILTEERLIERQPRRGARVALLTEREFEEISSLRVVLEQFVALRVQERWVEEAESRLSAIVANMLKAAEEDDVPRMGRYDREFHQTLWEMSDHALLVDFTAKLRGRISVFLQAANSTLGANELRAHAKSHEEIIKALAGDDKEHLRTTIAEHIGDAAERIRRRELIVQEQGLAKK